MPITLRGWFAALPTHRQAEGGIDLEAIERHAEFVLGQGASGIVPCGGTGEYFDLALAQRKEIVEHLIPIARGRGQLLAGVGSGSFGDSVQLAQHALNKGADAVLLPPPHFYSYWDGYLEQFFRTSARAIGGPVLIYNLAAFVSEIQPALIAELVGTETHIIGVKDSSGRLETLRLLTSCEISCARIQGHDARVLESMEEGLLDASISGPASVVPEAVRAVFQAFARSDRPGTAGPDGRTVFRTVADRDAFLRAGGQLEEFVKQSNRFPYPWVIKWTAQYRGLGPATLPVPLSERQDQGRRAFLDWLAAWLQNISQPHAPASKH